ncbi:MAG: tyrosine-type recombinase/integrase [Bdellovibrio sp.]|nr:tyrosine-type recombinase/integrase [Bdellovibrio sp.]
MEVTKLMLRKDNAMDIWKSRHLFQFQNFTVISLVRIYLELHPTSHFNERKKHYLSFLKTFQKYKIQDLNATLLQAWFTQTQAENNLVEKTLHRIKCQLNLFFKWLKKEGITIINHLDTIRFRQNIEGLRSRIILSADELKDLCANAKKHSGTTFYPVLYTLIHTGARRSEVINLQWKDIDFENNMIIFSRTKNGESRKIKMSSHLRLLFEKLPKTKPYIFFNCKGTRASGHSMSRAIQRFKRIYP